ncbi:hypothetical protein GCM10028818_61780 [Spirosoma horti]
MIGDLEPLDNEAIFRALVMESPIPIALLVGRELIITVANEPQLAVWGKGNTVFGLPLAKAIPELEGQPFLAILDEVFTTGVTFATNNTPAQMLVDGVAKTVYFDFSFKALKNKQGAVHGIIATGVEITQQVATHQALLVREEQLRQQSKALDRLVAERTQQLQESIQDLSRSNQNLEQFAYIASHDLQEPLRKIQQFGDLLKSRYAGSTEEELLYLDRMQTAASRMSLLIKDLLTFSRISTSQAVTQPVRLGQVITQVLDDLSVAIEESGAQIEVDRLPTVQGDKSQLNQLFQNLISNAIKFGRRTTTGEVVTPRITVRTSRILRNELPALLGFPRYAEAYHRIEVADNGIGFDSKYVDRIFQVFQRLHGKNEFAGTGIGLAVVQKVVTNHGGALTANSKLGEGAVFSVYLPA